MRSVQVLRASLALCVLVYLLAEVSATQHGDALTAGRKHHRRHHTHRSHRVVGTPVPLAFSFNEPRSNAAIEKICQATVNQTQFETALNEAYSLITAQIGKLSTEFAGQRCEAAAKKWFGDAHMPLAKEVIGIIERRITGPTGPLKKAISIHRWADPKNPSIGRGCENPDNVMYTLPTHNAQVTVCFQSYIYTPGTKGAGDKGSCEMRPTKYLAETLFHEISHLSAGTNDLGYSEALCIANVGIPPTSEVAELKLVKPFKVTGQPGASASAQNYAFWFRDCFLQ